MEGQGCRWREKRSRSSSSGSSPRKSRQVNSCSRRGVRSRVPRMRQRLQRSRSPIRRRVRRSAQRSKSQSASPPREREKQISKESKEKGERFAPSPEKDSLLENITKCSMKSVIIKPNSRLSTEHDDNEARNRCRDFDEKGLCMRGELCPYDHGSDPLVLELEDIISSSNNTSVAAKNCPPKSETEKPGRNFMNSFISMKPVSGEYYPESPSIVPPPFGWSSQTRHFRPRHLNLDAIPFSGPGGMLRPHFLRPYGPRQLVNIPVGGVTPPVPDPVFMGSAFSGNRLMCNTMLGIRGRGRGHFDFRRLGARPNLSNSSCCLEVRKVPQELNRIETLIGHFSRFGNVVSIQINFDGDSEGALVIFNQHEEALRAFRSTDAVLNNRFIRVFWHPQESNENPCTNATPMGILSSSVLGNYVEDSPEAQNLMTNIFLPQNDVNFAEVFKPLCQQNQGNEENKHTTLIRALAPPTIASSVEPVPLKNTTDILQAEQKRRQDMMTLMNVQIQEQKNLIQTVEENRERMTQKQREEIMKIIKTLQKSCQELRNNIELPSLNENTKLLPISGYSIKNSQDEILRKILDAELELYARERTGQETSDVEKKILRLRAEETSVV